MQGFLSRPPGALEAVRNHHPLQRLAKMDHLLARVTQGIGEIDDRL
jgi:hypothetical protein